MPTVSLHTLGCKLNHAETSTIGRQFVDRGYAIVEFGRPADVCVINTCTVTHRADRECRQLIRRALRTSPDSFVIVTGCQAQLQPEAIASIKGVDLVLGTREKFDVFTHAGELGKRTAARVVVSDIAAGDDFGAASSSIPGEQTRAFLKVQDGCDYTCAYCTIPLARGASRSLPPAECVRHAEQLAAQGYREVVLTGVNVGDYEGGDGSDFLQLLTALVTVPGIERWRISSIEPNLLTDDLLRFIATEPKMCPHLHLPLQSGDDDVLRLMRRRYTTTDFAALVNRIRLAIPHAGIGVDVIVGFPGETEASFAVTHEFIARLPVSYLHVFTYSERPNTPAAGFPHAVEPRERFARNDALRLLGHKKRQAFMRAMIGTRQEILVERDMHGSDRLGFTGNYIRTAVSADAATENTLLQVEIRGIRGDLCVAQPATGGT